MSLPDYERLLATLSAVEQMEIETRATCGCVHRAEECTPCKHDVALFLKERKKEEEKAVLTFLNRRK